MLATHLHRRLRTNIIQNNHILYIYRCACDAMHIIIVINIITVDSIAIGIVVVHWYWY